jgi:uncharacterized protein (TIGR02452 family)
MSKFWDLFGSGKQSDQMKQMQELQLQQLQLLQQQNYRPKYENEKNSEFSSSRSQKKNQKPNVKMYIVVANQVIAKEQLLPLNIHRPLVFHVNNVCGNTSLVAGKKKGEIFLFNGSTNQAVHHFHNKKSKCAVLNFANSHTPGGGYTNGASAQEEDLCRTITDLYESLCLSEEFPFNWDEIVQYSKDQSLYRLDSFQSHDYKMFTKTDPIKVSVITASAPQLSNDELETMTRSNMAKLQKKIKNLIYTCCLSPSLAEDNDVDTLVLGAFGCGVFAPDQDLWNLISDIKYNELIALIFCSVIKNHPLLLTKFTNICFAIPNAMNDNYEAFKGAFSTSIEFTELEATDNKIPFVPVKPTSPKA